MATCAAHLANPAHPAAFFGIPKLSGFDFFRFFIDFDAFRAPEFIEKQLKNLGSCIVFIFSVKSLPNQKSVAMGRAGALKMEARRAQNHPSRRPNESRELPDEA